MTVSDVYCINTRTALQENLLQKLERLAKEAGMVDIDFNNKYTAIKIHFGEPENLVYPRPNYSKVLVDLIRPVNGRVFLMDCNTLYVGRRKSVLDHLDAVYENEYDLFTIGYHVIIVDRPEGTDEALVSIDDDYIKEAEIGRAIMDADIVVSSTHSRGHEAAGLGDALKNSGTGCGLGIGKMEMYNVGRPYVHTTTCIGYGSYKKNCAHEATSTENRKVPIDTGKCVGCSCCIGACPMDVVCVMDDETNDIPNMKIVEYSLVVLKDRPNLHVSLMVDVSPFCDCHGENGMFTIPNMGMLVSFDPVTLGVVCAGTVSCQPVFTGGYLVEREHTYRDYFTDTYPDTNWGTCIDHAVKLGSGNKEYNPTTIWFIVPDQPHYKPESHPCRPVSPKKHGIDTDVVRILLCRIKAYVESVSGLSDKIKSESV